MADEKIILENCFEILASSAKQLISEKPNIERPVVIIGVMDNGTVFGVPNTADNMKERGILIQEELKKKGRYSDGFVSLEKTVCTLKGLDEQLCIKAVLINKSLEIKKFVALYSVINGEVVWWGDNNSVNKYNNENDWRKLKTKEVLSTEGEKLLISLTNSYYSAYLISNIKL